MKLSFISRRFKGERFDESKCKPDELVMLVDLDRCIGCGACALACRIEHEDAPGSGEPMRPVLTVNEPSARMVCLPLTCRHCETPCEYQDDYNFWTICPSKTTRSATEAFCDSCVQRLGDDLWPVCATRCTMKTIYFGRPKEMALIFNEKRWREMGDVEFEG